MASVTFSKLTKKYAGDITAVNDFSLDIADGEFLTLVGPSGCGKSTLLRLAAGLEAPTSGEILIDGQSMADVPPLRRRVAMVFQNDSLYPHMNVYKNIALGLEAGGLSRGKIEQVVTAAAQTLGITDLLNRTPRGLSGGQKQRVALGRAMVRKPQVFLLDEPLSDLDAAMRVDLRAEMVALHRELGVTFIQVTHDQAEALTMGTRLAVMRGGRLEQADSPDKIYGLPCNIFVAGFVGQGMNLFEARIEGKNVQLCGLTFETDAAAIERQQGEVTLGFRPEDMVLTSESGLAAEVMIVEPTGATALLRARHGDLKITVIAPAGGAWQPGEVIYLRPNFARAHVFSRQTGRRI